jgi:hypothetical protein
MNPIHNAEHALYRFFGAGGVLLYVGLTVQLPIRLRDHHRGRAWWSEVERMTVQRYPGRPEVIAAERLAIINEKPKYNIQHNGSKGKIVAAEPEQEDIIISKTFVGSFFHADSDRQWQGYVLEALGDGYFFVVTYSWLSGHEYTRHVVRITDMAQWRFYPSDEAMRLNSENVQAIWKREIGESPE